MANVVKIHDVRMLTPVLVTFTDLSDIDWPAELENKNNRKPHEELFYFDITGDVKYVTTPTLPVPEYLKKAIFEYVGLRTPSIEVPPMPQKPDYDPESFKQM
jgi:hypothetical protein